MGAAYLCGILLLLLLLKFKISFRFFGETGMLCPLDYRRQGPPAPHPAALMVWRCTVGLHIRKSTSIKVFRAASIFQKTMLNRVVQPLQQRGLTVEESGLLDEPKNPTTILCGKRLGKHSSPTSADVPRCVWTAVKRSMDATAW